LRSTIQMARDIEPKCRKCRRAGEKLFLKGDRCNSAKCGVVKRAYAPGMHGKKMSRASSEYGMQLSTKQKIKRIYGILEKQFRNHFDEIKNKKGITGDLLFARLEMRLDNVVYRMGLATSRAAARQLVNHGLISVDGRKVTIPSFEVKVGQVVGVNASKKEKNYFKNIDQALKNKKDFPSWLDFDASKKEGKIVSFPERRDIGIDIDAQVIVEYYSR
jgi:small subunit ribosomal protein S4